MPIFALDQGWLVGDVSTIALIFIMFYGGFGTRWKSARPVVVEAGLLATIGVALTALFVGMFCHWVMGWEWLESLLIAQAAVLLLRRISFKNNGFDLLIVLAIALISYALPDMVGGNGYLSAYIVGIVLGNVDFPARKSLVSLFDSITSLMQIIIFFLLGMLAIPANLLHSILPALAIFACLTFVARPLAVFGVLTPFRKYPANQMSLISFTELRGGICDPDPDFGYWDG